MSVTFWGTEFFKSVDENEVRFGERIETVISWNAIILPDEMTGTLRVAAFVQRLLVTSALLMVPLLVALQRSMLSFWMLAVTLQLISHMALMSNMQPAEVILFLQQILGHTRLFYSDNAPQEQSMSAIFKESGYTQKKFANNLSTTMLVLLPLIIVLIGILVAIEHLVTKKRGKELPMRL